MVKNGQNICNRSLSLPENSGMRLWCSTPSAPQINSMDTTLSISRAANAFWCLSQESCWTCCSSIWSSTELCRTSSALHKEWWHCYAVFPRRTCRGTSLRTGQVGEKCPLRMNPLSTFQPFWSLSRKVCKSSSQTDVLLEQHHTSPIFLILKLKRCSMRSTQPLVCSYFSDYEEEYVIPLLAKDFSEYCVSMNHYGKS